MRREEERREEERREEERREEKRREEEYIKKGREFLLLCVPLTDCGGN